MTLEERVAKIEERNNRVETDKAWELSYTRRIVVFALTFISIGLILQALHVVDPWLNGIIASIGFLLSLLILPWAKTLWVKYLYKH